MSEKIDHIASPSRSAAPLGGARAWLISRLKPEGNNILMLSVYVGIVLTMIIFVLNAANVPPWKFYSTILLLSALLVLHATHQDREERYGPLKAAALHLPLSGLLFLAATVTGLGRNSFLPYILFMLTGEAMVMLRFRYALLYSLVLAVLWLGVLIPLGASLENLINTSVNIGMGMFFTTLFALVIVGYIRQKEQADRLLSQLQAANAELDVAREREKTLAVAEERVRLARDIHDGLGHHLTVLNVQLQAAAKLVDRDPSRVARVIDTCREVAQAALEEVRHSVAAMRRTPLDGRSLEDALAALVHDFDRHASARARFVQEGEPVVLSPAASMTLYRAAQEGLTNAQKHAQASEIVVSLRFLAKAVRLMVQDNGLGASGGGGGFGLAGLRERAEQLGGTFSAAPRAEGGFEIDLVLPIV